jgi:hypothetical protein
MVKLPVAVNRAVVFPCRVPKLSATLPSASAAVAITGVVEPVIDADAGSRK